MNLDDKTLISAYLDDELGPGQRLVVESSLATSPLLADDLRRLTAVRDLVASLPRPVAPPGLAHAVAARIEGRRPGRPLKVGPWLLPRRPALMALATGGLAAAILIALMHSKVDRVGVLRPHENQVALAPASAPLAVPSSGVVHHEAEASARRPAALPPSPPLAQSSIARTMGRDLGEPERELDRKRIRELLDDPGLRKVFVVTDVVGGRARDQVDSLVQQATRENSTYGRITVGQGIVIDPTHPNEATVFALSMDEDELRAFRSKLIEAFPGAVEEKATERALVARLAEAGQVAVLPGHPAADLTVPTDTPAQVALRANSTQERFFDRSKLSRMTNGEVMANDASVPPQEPGANLGPQAASRTQEPALPQRYANGSSIGGAARKGVDDSLASARRPGGPAPYGLNQPQAGKPPPSPSSAPARSELVDHAKQVRDSLVLVWVTTRGPSGARPR